MDAVRFLPCKSSSDHHTPHFDDHKEPHWGSNAISGARPSLSMEDDEYNGDAMGDGSKTAPREVKNTIDAKSRCGCHNDLGRDAGSSSS